MEIWDVWNLDGRPVKVSLRDVSPRGHRDRNGLHLRIQKINATGYYGSEKYAVIEY